MLTKAIYMQSNIAKTNLIKSFSSIWHMLLNTKAKSLKFPKIIAPLARFHMKRISPLSKTHELQCILGLRHKLLHIAE